MALQEILTAVLVPLVSVSGNGTASNATVQATSGMPMSIPSDITSLVAMLFSLGALRDWLKLIVIGSVLETARRFAFSAYYNFTNAFFVTANFEEEDASYLWMMVWLSKQPTWSKAREVQITTRRFGLAGPGSSDDDEDERKNHKISLLPNVSNTHTIWYKHRPIWVTRTRADTGYYGRKEETLTLRILSRSHRVLNKLLQEAKDQYLASQENQISIYASDIQGGWRCVANRPKRPLRSIVLDPGMKDLLMDDAKDFLESKSWYQERGIPFRRGYLLYGAPGSGKTSIIHSIAGELGLDVYIVSLSRVGMDDSTLSELISELPERCIALMEDIDAAFHHGLNRDDNSAPTTITTSNQTNTPPPNGAPPPPPASGNRLSLSGLLNALDGVGAQEGRILFATTNKYLSLDAALCRPGRMDLHVEFKLASKFQARELYRCFYMPPAASDSEENMEEAKEKDAVESDDEPESGPLVDLETSSQTSESSSTSGTLFSPTSPKEPEKAFFLQSHRQRAPKLSKSQVSKLAQTFADLLPEREFSMASLQGYLMMYKTRPFDAVKDIRQWVEKERADAAKKASSKLSETPIPIITSETPSSPVEPTTS